MSKLKEHQNEDSGILRRSFFPSGSRVRVRDGQLVGMEGTVACQRGALRFLVQLQHGIAVEIDAHLLEGLS